MNDDKDKIANLSTVGFALYGSNWKSELARNLGMNDRAIRQWANGERRIPDTAFSEINLLVQDKIDALEAVKVGPTVAQHGGLKELKLDTLKSLGAFCQVLMTAINEEREFPVLHQICLNAMKTMNTHSANNAAARTDLEYGVIMTAIHELIFADNARDIYSGLCGLIKQLSRELSRRGHDQLADQIEDIGTTAP